MQPWEHVASESTHDYRIFTARVDQIRSPRTGHVLRRVVLDTPDWINVVARTTGGQFVLVRQVRHGIAAPSLEIPAGMVEPGEAPELAATRELLEETGYQGRMRWLGQVYPNPAFQGNTCYHFLAEDCEYVAEPQLDPGEDIQVELWSWPQILEAVRSGEVRHSLMISALFYYRDQLEAAWNAAPA